MIETKEKTIGAYDVKVTQLAFFKALRLFTRLVKTVGPGFVKLFDVAGKDGGGAAVATMLDSRIDDLAPAFAALCQSLDPDVMEQIATEIAVGSQIKDPSRGAYVPLEAGLNVVVGGDFWAGMQILAFALSVHFGNFSFARDAIAGLGRKAKESPSAASTTSTDSRVGS